MAIPNGSRDIHLRLREHRIQAGFSPNDLAYRAQISGKAVRMAELGFIPRPRIQFAIAAVFGLKPLDLWPLVDDRQQVAA